jgi:glyoxalase family protein
MSPTPVGMMLTFWVPGWSSPGEFEIATDNPGFAADEPLDRLGTSLCLPSWFEPHRAQIEPKLPRLLLPTGQVVGGR